jgi:hypothetical protein
MEELINSECVHTPNWVIWISAIKNLAKVVFVLSRLDEDIVNSGLDVVCKWIAKIIISLWSNSINACSDPQSKMRRKFIVDSLEFIFDTKNVRPPMALNVIGALCWTVKTWLSQLTTCPAPTSLSSTIQYSSFKPSGFLKVSTVIQSPPHSIQSAIKGLESYPRILSFASAATNTLSRRSQHRILDISDNSCISNIQWDK